MRKDILLCSSNIHHHPLFNMAKIDLQHTLEASTKRLNTNHLCLGRLKITSEVSAHDTVVQLPPHTSQRFRLGPV